MKITYKKKNNDIDYYDDYKEKNTTLLFPKIRSNLAFKRKTTRINSLSNIIAIKKDITLITTNKVSIKGLINRGSPLKTNYKTLSFNVIRIETQKTRNLKNDRSGCKINIDPNFKYKSFIHPRLLSQHVHSIAEAKNR